MRAQAGACFDPHESEVKPVSPPRTGPAAGDGRFARIMTAFGHRMIYLMAVTVTAHVCYDALGQPGMLTPPSTALTFLFDVSLYAEFRYHSRRLCGACMARTPADPQAAVNRWRKALWLVHHRRAVVVCTILLIVGVLGENVMRAHHAAWAASAVDAAVFLALGIWALAGWKHQPLMPWCPWCHWGDGGNSELFPEVPDPAAAR